MVSSEIVMGSESGCPIEVHQIEIEKCDEMYDHECEGGKSIPFHRAGYDRYTGQSPNTPRQQVSERLYSHDTRFPGGNNSRARAEIRSLLGRISC